MIPTRWSSAVDILRRRLAADEEERRLLEGVHTMLDHDAEGALAAGDGDERDDDAVTEPAFVVRWFLPQRP